MSSHREEPQRPDGDAERDEVPPIEPSGRFEAITVDKGPGLWGRIAKAIPGLSWNDTEPAHVSEKRRD